MSAALSSCVILSQSAIYIISSYYSFFVFTPLPSCGVLSASQHSHPKGSGSDFSNTQLFARWFLFNGIHANDTATMHGWWTPPSEGGVSPPGSL